MLFIERSMTEHLVLGIRWIKLGQKQVIVIFWNSFVILCFMRWVSMVNRLLIWHILFNAWIRYEHARDTHIHWTEPCCFPLQFDAGSHDKICLTSRDEQKRDHRELFRITSSLRTGLYRIDELWSSRIFMNARRVLFKAHYSSFCLPASVYKDISQVSLFHCSTFLSCIKKIHMLFFSFFNVVVC